MGNGRLQLHIELLTENAHSQRRDTRNYSNVISTDVRYQRTKESTVLKILYYKKITSKIGYWATHIDMYVMLIFHSNNCWIYSFINIFSLIIFSADNFRERGYNCMYVAALTIKPGSIRADRACTAATIRVYQVAVF